MDHIKKKSSNTQNIFLRPYELNSFYDADKCKDLAFIA